MVGWEEYNSASNTTRGHKLYMHILFSTHIYLHTPTLRGHTYWNMLPRLLSSMAFYSPAQVLLLRAPLPHTLSDGHTQKPPWRRSRSEP